jgi:HEAT repeat protein
VRGAAAIAIGRLGYTKGAEALRRALDDEWVDVRAAATAALYRLGDQSMLELAKARLETPMREAQLAAADAWAPERPGPWVAEIEPMLRNPTAEIRLAAAERLATHRHPQVVTALQADLEPGMPDETRIEAARVAADIATAGDAAWLARALTDPLPEVQIYAAGAILRVTGAR